MNEEKTLPLVRADRLPRADEQRPWLVQTLWGMEAVGILAGHPKSGKSWLGLDLALSVASGTACMDRFRVERPGKALIYLAEDALPQVRKRLETISAHRGVSLQDLPLWAISVPQLRLDREDDQDRLEQTVHFVRPSLLLLDPLVRLHQLDENDAMAIARLLAYLRTLQRKYHLAVLLVHHARKNGGTAGMALRGSSDLWAWGDSNLYLKRVQGKLLLNAEHRTAASVEPIALHLLTDDPQKVHLEVLDEKSSEPSSNVDLPARLDEALNPGPMTRTQLRAVLGIKNERLGKLLADAVQAKRIRHTKQGWSLCRNNGAPIRDEASRSLFPL
jgi:hypothetical protein